MTTMPDPKKARNQPQEEPQDTVEVVRNFPEMITIPAGIFLMGASPSQVQQLLYKEEWAEEWYERFMFAIEQPQHKLKLPAYEIGRFPVTNAQYHEFAWAIGYRMPRYWIGFTYPEETGDHPVVGISRVDAMAYCKWLSAETGQEYRLPTESEWEKAAHGPDGRVYPWGDEFNPWRCNTIESGKRTTTPAGFYSPGGDSPYGVTDMAGNVWEWTGSWMRPYPYHKDDGREDPAGSGTAVVRGGAWYYSRALARTTAREAVIPTYVSPSLGFRVARSLD